MNADDIDLILTSGGYPEQYDATYNGETIGYLRLRHGHFTVEKDGPFGELLYEHSFSDSFKGMFDPDEREKFLNTAKQHLAHSLNKEGEGQMSDFIASNGVTVSHLDDGSLRFQTVTSIDKITAVNGLAKFWADALREYFQAERDRELGRWRDPVNPDYVVYPDVHRLYISQPAIIVINEKTGGVADCSEDGSVSSYGVGAKDSENWLVTAERYFEAHPEKQPWHDARHEEVWVITAFGDTGPGLASTSMSSSSPLAFRMANGTLIPVTDPGITDARRIWPEEGEGQ